MKKFLVILLTLSVCIGLFSEIVPTFDLSPTAVLNGNTAANRDMWDVLYTFDASAASHPGIETDGTNIYTVAWNAGTFSRYDMDGGFLADFTVAGASNIRDMAYDGTYFYGSPASMTISIMDLANGTLIGTIGVSCSGVTGVRHIAYDPGLDGGNGGFWVGNWNELGAITMSGAQIHANVSPTPQSNYGCAYDPWTVGGPYLWVFSQDGSGAELHQFDIASLSFTGVMHDASDIPGASVPPMAGGLATYVDDDGLFVMLTNLQQTPNLVGIYEISATADPGFIEGTVTLDGGAGDIEDVEVSVGNITVNPDADGDYTITITAGVYDVTAELDGYEDNMVTGVVVEEGLTTDGVDITLLAITYDAPINLAVDAETALFTWDAPGGGTGELFELIQHSNEAENAYYQNFDYGYGVVYDLSGFNNVTIEELDFRHSAWGLFGTWDYSIHIVDWDTFTELAVVTGLQTTGDDQWEEGIDLGSVSESGLVGIFLEPQGNIATDAYPDVDADNVLDGTSFYGDLSDYSAFDASGVGDFLMDLWIMGEETRELVKAKKFRVTQNTENARKATQLVDFVTTQQSVLSRDLTGYKVYLDNDLQGVASNTEWQFDIATLTSGVIYEAGLIAVYNNPTGESDYVSVDFEFDPQYANNNLVMVTELTGNYPNPFNPVTNISYSIVEAGNVSLEIYNMKGQLVRTLVNEIKESGTYEVTWNGTDDDNRPVSSGIYFYKMKAGDKYTSTKKMILLK